MSPDTATATNTKLSERSRVLLCRANESVAVERSRGYRDFVPAKRALLCSFDALGIDDVLAVCYWGRSGSRLFTSFLDGHDHILMLPMEESQRIYEFLVVHSDLPLRDRLIAYPFYVDSYTPIFSGEFPIEPLQYYAAVDAVIEAYSDQPPEVLSASRTFFQFLHVAYSLAIGRYPAVPRPVIVYAQHRLNYHSAHLVSDFPKAHFAHTVRDPISCFDSTFAFYLTNAIEKQQVERVAYPEAVLRTLVEMTSTDCPNRGMDARTRAIRFEDLHAHTEEVMRAVADWLKIPYQPSLIESSFNGVPWTVTRNGKSWSGALPSQAIRRSPNMWLSDRALVYSLFHEDFAAWNYRHPRVFESAMVRRLVAAVLWIIPTKIELLNASPTLRRRFLPAAVRGDFVSAFLILKALLACHRELMKRLRVAIRARTGGALPVLEALDIPAYRQAARP